VRDCNGGLALFENSSGVGDDTAIQRLVLRQDWFFNCHRRGLFGSCRFSVEVAFVFECIEEVFPTGMWTRERQPRSGNWRAHGAVNVGSDIKPDFPRHQVRRRFYANVDPRLRELWRRSPEKAASHGFGRVELLPLKYGGAACARCFKKYLAKSFGCEKRSGDEKCRLFGVWGVFVSHIHVSHS
jgi:hypothetical protein